MIYNITTDFPKRLQYMNNKKGLNHNLNITSFVILYYNTSWLSLSTFYLSQISNYNSTRLKRVILFQYLLLTEVLKINCPFLTRSYQNVRIKCSYIKYLILLIIDFLDWLGKLILPSSGIINCDVISNAISETTGLREDVIHNLSTIVED